MGSRIACFLGLLAAASCASSSSLEARPLNTSAVTLNNVTLRQTLSFNSDSLRVCASISSSGSDTLLLRAPLAFGRAQLRVNLEPENGPLPAPLQNEAPDPNDLLSYDLLPPDKSVSVCIDIQSNQLPEGTFPIRTVYQPWTRAGAPLLTRFALQPGIFAPDVPAEGVATPNCEVDLANLTIDCR